MTYSNQRDHPLLDRMIVRDLLLGARRGDGRRASPAERTRAEHSSML